MRLFGRPSPSARPGDVIAAYRESYAAGEIELWEFEVAVDRALTGKASARPEPDEWVVLAHERRLRELEAQRS